MKVIRIVCQYCHKSTDCGIDPIVDFREPQAYQCANEECEAHLCEVFESNTKSNDEEFK